MFLLLLKLVEYDPNRSAHLALLKYADGERRYIIAPSKIKVGDPVLISRSNRNEVLEIA